MMALCVARAGRVKRVQRRSSEGDLKWVIKESEESE